jgi:2,4-dienoyl-CoA reductase-like NADH-dependent reductase (Old Yellow Enzyme family)
MREYYVQRAKGGAGLIISEGALISQQGTEWENAPGIWNKEQVIAWRKITDAVHAEGGVMFCQLWHVGRLAHPDAPEQKASGAPVYAPSAIVARGYTRKFRFLPGTPGYVMPTAIEDPRELVELYRNGAVNAKEAGFDGVELHGGFGYLIHQFLDSTSNQRTDSYGGSVANRARFALEALEAAVDVFGPKHVAIKLLPSGGGNDVGMPLNETIETFGYLLREAEKLDLAYFCFLRYSTDFDMVVEGKLRATKHDVLATYHPFIETTPIFLNGNVEPEEAASLVASGQIDAAVFGRLWIGHPDLAKRIEHGKPLDGQIDYSNVYGQGPNSSEEASRKGYTDYPDALY